MSKEILLTRGLVALVDDSWFDELNKFKWRVMGSKRNYAVRQEQGKTIFMHRVIAGTPEGQVCDHINGDGLDNRSDNLRNCTDAQNAHNNHIKKPGCSSAFKGVFFDGRRRLWMASICDGGHQIVRGPFRFEIEAAIARDKLAKDRWGEFAFLNFPDGIYNYPTRQLTYNGRRNQEDDKIRRLRMLPSAI